MQSPGNVLLFLSVFLCATAFAQGPKPEQKKEPLRRRRWRWRGASREPNERVFGLPSISDSSAFFCSNIFNIFLLAVVRDLVISYKHTLGLF